MVKKYIEAELLKGYMYTGLTGNDLYTPHGIENFVNDLPAADVVPVAEIYDAGYKGKEVQFHIGGRLFAVRELAQ